MSALVIPPSPRLYAGSAASAQESAAVCYEGERPRKTAGRAQGQERSGGSSRRRGHLRLVTPDFVPVPVRAEGPHSSPVSLTPRMRGRQSRGSDVARTVMVSGVPSRPTNRAGVTRVANGEVADLRQTETEMDSVASVVLPPMGERPHTRTPALPDMAVQKAAALERGERKCEVTRLRSAVSSVPVTQAAAVRTSRRVPLSPAMTSAASVGIPTPIRRILAVIGGMVAAAFLLAGGIVLSGFTSVPTGEQTVVVQTGESLWDIAAASGSPDVAHTVAHMIDINNLDGSTIHPGQTLRVPSN